MLTDDADAELNKHLREQMSPMAKRIMAEYDSKSSVSDDMPESKSGGTSPMQVGKIEQLSFKPVELGPKDLEFLKIQKSFKAEPVVVPIELGKPVFGEDGSLSIQAVYDWLDTLKPEFAKRGAIRLMIDLIRRGSDSQAVMVYDVISRKIEDWQFEIDCEVECIACGKKDKYAPALWDEESNGYWHTHLKGGQKEWCDASILFMYWAETHKGEYNGK